MPGSRPLRFPPGIDPDQLMTIEEVAVRCGFASPGAVYVNRYRGLSPGVLAIKWGDRLFWRKADVEAWLKERTTEAFDRQWKRRNDKSREPITTRAAELAAARKAAGDE